MRVGGPVEDGSSCDEASWGVLSGDDPLSPSDSTLLSLSGDDPPPLPEFESRPPPLLAPVSPTLSLFDTLAAVSNDALSRLLSVVSIVVGGKLCENV